jgi:hypothetical protein
LSGLGEAGAAEAFEFEWPLAGEVAERWSESAYAGLLDFIRRLPIGWLSADEIESRIEWWWRGENRALRKAMESVHRSRCERGRNWLINRVTGEMVRNRCKSWRDCSYCAWLYGKAVRELLGQVKGLRAFVVFTMPSALGDWKEKSHLQAQGKAMHRLAERLKRKFGHRFGWFWSREHNTKGGGPGRLHLNVLWDEDWVDQAWLSEAAEACGFGAIVHISRVRDDGRIVSGKGKGGRLKDYVTKTFFYASKDLGSQADWPKHTRRWSASRTVRAQMKRPERNPDWFFALEPPPQGFLPCDFGRYRRLRPDEMRAQGIACVCADFIACVCGAWEQSGMPRVQLSREERRKRDRASPGDAAA